MVSTSREWMQNVWIGAQLGAPAPVQRAIVPRLHEAKEIARLLIRPYLPVCLMEGQGSGGPLTVAYAGLEFGKPFLKSILFQGQPDERRAGRVPLWRCGRLADLSSDMVIAEATKRLICRLSDQNAIVLPEFVHHVLDVRGEWEEVQSRFPKTIRRNELRLMRKYGYEYDVSHDPQDFETFYYQMYLPTTRDRHGELSSPMSVAEARQYFRHGWLFRIWRDGDWVSGVVCRALQGTLMAIISGVKNADERLVHEGATVGTYYGVVRWANQRGYQAVNFLGSDPYLEGGLFQHKRKWGTTISIPPHLHRRIWIHVRRVTPAVSQFLKENPFVVVGKDGKLHGLIVVDDPHNVPAEVQEEWQKRYVTPGLDSLVVCSMARFASGQARVDDPDLIVPGVGSQE